MLGRGISINATTVAVMSVLGPTIGSAILSVAPWPWIFAVNLPVCVLAMLGLRHLPEVPRNNVAFDGISALLSMATLGVFISGVDMMGADLLRGIGLVAIAAVLGIVLMRRASARPRRWCRWTCCASARWPMPWPRPPAPSPRRWRPTCRCPSISSRCWAGRTWKSAC